MGRAVFGGEGPEVYFGHVELGMSLGHLWNAWESGMNMIFKVRRLNDLTENRIE